MTNAFSRALLLACLFAASVFAALPASAQQVTDEQRSAIRSACRSDYVANCSSVSPGGAAAFQCLQKNMASLSAACQRAVSAIEPAAAAPKTETAPKGEAAPKTEAAPKAETTPAKSEAPKSEASKTESPKTEATPTAKNAPAVAAKAAASPPATATKKTSPPSAIASAPATPVSPPAAADTSTDAPPPPVIVLRPMRPREVLFVLRSACRGDAQAVCPDVIAGGGRIVQCLAANAPALSPACKDVLGQFAAQ